jgi:DNA polymerase III beta subunit
MNTFIETDVKRIVCSSLALYKSLLVLGKCISKNPIIPVAENVFIEASNDQLVLIGTNIYTFIKNTVYVNDSRKDQQIKVCVNYFMLVEVLKFIPEQPITINISDARFEISTDDGKTTLECTSYLDFPIMPQVENVQEKSIVPISILSILESFKSFVSHDELKVSMTYIEVIYDDGIRIAATDGHRLAYILKGNDTDFKFKMHFNETLIKIMKCFYENAEMVVFEKNTFLKSGKIEVTFRHLDASVFPRWENAISPEPTLKICLNKSRLTTLLKRSKVTSRKYTSQVIFSIEEKKVLISSNDFNFNCSSDLKIEAEESNINEKFKIGFNCNFLLTVLASLKKEDVYFQMQKPNTFVLISQESSDEKFLIMPVMVNQYE